MEVTKDIFDVVSNIFHISEVILLWERYIRPGSLASYLSIYLRNKRVEC